MDEVIDTSVVPASTGDTVLVSTEIEHKKLRAPFPYFGGKSRSAHLIWPRFGDVPNYVEAFAGSLAVMLSRPHKPQTETVNDLDCMIANFWRALQNDPEAVGDYADQPVNEADLHARQLWLVNRVSFRERMMTDPDYYDAKIAGWWVWGRCSWIGGGWCETVTRSTPDERMKQVEDIYPDGIECAKYSIPNMTQQGVQSKRILAQGVQAHMYELAARLRNVRVTCGDWSRVCTPAVTDGRGLTAIVLDPPYFAGLSTGLYQHSDASVSGQVRQWAIDNGGNKQLRICLCGYEGEHKMPDDWETVAWKAAGGYGGQRKDGSNENAERERLWFSPHCLKPSESLFGDDFGDDDDS
jgi:site-specific DNA-adenine methylase